MLFYLRSAFIVALTIFTFMFTFDTTYSQTCYSPDSPSPPNEFEKIGVGDATRHKWINQNGTPLVSCYDKTAERIGELKLGQVFKVVKDNFRIDGENGELYSLLVPESKNKVTSDTITGWVNHKYLADARPLKDPTNKLPIRILITEAGYSQADQSDQRKLTILGRPRSTAITKTDVFVSSAFYVFDTYPENSLNLSDNIDPLKKVEYLLISPSLHLSDTDDFDPMLFGWVPRKSVELWETQIGIELNPGKSYKIRTDSGKIINFRKTRKDRYNEMRAPVIAVSDNENEYRIGLFYDLQAEPYMAQQRISRIQTGLEVMFVIDATRSMTTTFKAVKTAVETTSYSLTKSAKELGLKLPQFAAIFYRDEAEGENVYYKVNEEKRSIAPEEIDDYPNYHTCKKEITTVKFSSVDSFSKRIKEERACDADGTRPESVLKALHDALTNSRHHWSRERRRSDKFSVIVLIGDAGDNGSGGFSAAKIKDVIMTNKNSLKLNHLIAIDVSGQSGEETEFTRLLKPIIADTDQKDVRSVYKRMVSAANLDSFLINQLKNYQRKAEAVQMQISNIAKGWVNSEVYSASSEGRTGIAGLAQGVGIHDQGILKQALETIKANGLDINDVTLFRKFISGTITKSKDTIEKVYVSHPIITEMQTNINNLQLGNLSSKTEKEKFWNTLMKSLVGTSGCTDPITGFSLSANDCAARYGGIPIKVGFMKCNRSQFIELEPHHFKDISCQLRILKHKLQKVASSRRPLGITKGSYQTSPCKYELKSTDNINGDEYIIKKMQNRIYRYDKNTGRQIGQASDSDPLDEYWFKQGIINVAWLPLDAFEVIIPDREFDFCK